VGNRRSGSEAYDGQQIIYVKRPVQEGGGGRRQVHRVCAGSRRTDCVRVGADLWVPDHQGRPFRQVDAYPYGRPRRLCLRPSTTRCWSRLDQGLQTRGNLGAVCRSAEFAGADRMVLPERAAPRRSRPLPARLPAGAPSSICRSAPRAQSRPTVLGGGQAPGSGFWGAPDFPRPVPSGPWDVDLTGPPVIVSEARAKAVDPVAKGVPDGLVLPLARRRVEVEFA